jgi:hypothetical protein
MFSIQEVTERRIELGFFSIALETGKIEPGFLSLIAGANAALAALDARKQSKETA